MKKSFVIGLIFVLLVAISSTVSCGKKEEETATTAKEVTKEVKKAEVAETAPSAALSDSLTSLLPEDTDFAITLGSIETIYTHLSVTKNSVFGEPVEDIEQIKADIGFNPLVLADLKANGLDTGKPLGFMINNFRLQKDEDPLFNGLFLIPVTDGKKAISAIKNMLSKEEGETITFAQEGNLTVFTSEKNKGYMAEKDNYLLVGMNPGEDARAFVESVLAGNTSLTDSQNYAKLIGKIDSTKEVFVYADVQKFMERNVETLKAISADATSSANKKPVLPVNKNLESLKDYRGAGLSVNFDSKDLIANIVADIAPESPLLNSAKGLNFDKNIALGLKDNPAILLSVALNPLEYYKTIQDMMDETGKQELRTRMEGIKTDFGVDPEKELIENLGGSLNFGIYDGISVNMTNYNILITLNLKDEAVMKGALDKAIAKLPPQQQSMVSKVKIGEDDVYVMTLFGMTQVYVGVKNNNLILSTGKPMFEKALAADVNAGFLSGMNDKELTNTLKADEGIFYINVEETFAAVKNLMTMLPMLNSGKPIDEKVSDAIRQIEYLLFTSKIERNTLISQVKVKTSFSEPFLKGLQNVAKVIKESGQAGQPVGQPGQAVGQPGRGTN